MVSFIRGQTGTVETLQRRFLVGKRRRRPLQEIWHGTEAPEEACKASLSLGAYTYTMRIRAITRIIFATLTVATTQNPNCEFRKHPPRHIHYDDITMQKIS
ncbi:hypothetical protein MPER_03160 [Moniliophthora perniciosa FA553]|nr:hypothetical protein MPER_03160 [Moniliophthora perniciosa FA553]